MDASEDEKAEEERIEELELGFEDHILALDEALAAAESRPESFEVEGGDEESRRHDRIDDTLIIK
jgi:hypothetical protein